MVFITWWSGLDYLKQGFPAVARAPAHRVLHWLRLGAGALLPVVVMAALAVPGLPTIPLVVLLASDMARGALDNFAANQGVADFSWAASMWAELLFLGAALVAPGVGSYLCLIAALIAVTETLRSLVRYLRAPEARPRKSARLAPPLKGADPQLERQAPEPVVER